MKQRIEALARTRGIDPDTWRDPFDGTGFWAMTLLEFAEECLARGEPAGEPAPDTEPTPEEIRRAHEEAIGEDRADST